MLKPHRHWAKPWTNMCMPWCVCTCIHVDAGQFSVLCQWSWNCVSISLLTHCRPGYESVQTPRVHPSSVSSSPTNIQATPPISVAGSGSNSPVSTPYPSATSGLTRVASTRGSPTQEILTEPSMGVGGALSSSAQPGSGGSGQNADSLVSTTSTNLPRTGSIIQQRRERRAIIGPPLTRQQHYLSRNYLHHDLQLPDGYGESHWTGFV